MSFPNSNGVWTKIKSAKQIYVTEASSLSANGGNDVKCPHCGVWVNQWREERVERNEEIEIVMWQHMCSCGTLLKVFND